AARPVLAAAAEAFPAASRLAVLTSGGATADLGATAVLDATALGASGIAARVLDPEVARTGRLVRTLRTLDEPVSVVMHDNPDPDAIGAAVGMLHLLDSLGREARAVYGGAISHQQNRAFVNLLELELERHESGSPLPHEGGVVLVDHAHPGVNDALPPETAVDVIVDHHPSREEATATFVDRRHDVGATSTLVADHLLRAGFDPDRRLATALWYGIQVDTAGFRRGVSAADLTIAAALRGAVDADILARIESPRVTAETLETVAAAIAGREVDGGVLVSDVGAIHDRDALAQAADELIDMAGVKTVCVFGHREEMIYASARTRDRALDLGDAMRIAYDQIGDAGGHEDMAGAQLPFGELPASADERSEMIHDRFRVGVAQAGRPLPSGYLEADDAA
ncbi:MAG: DHH family phosphoesterase, partial [Halobacteriota archaeon]